MIERLRTMTDVELEAALRDLGGTLRPPAAPDLARAVARRILAGESRRAGRGFPRRLPFLGRPVRRGLVLALAAVLVLAGIAAALGFGLPGLRFVFFGPTATSTATPARPGETPGLTPSPAPSQTPTRTPGPIGDLDLGRPVDLANVDSAAGYAVLLPTLPELGPPLAVYVDREPPHVRVSATYPAGAGFPAATGSEVAVLVTELPGRIEAGYFQKGIGPDTAVVPVTVAGHVGFWVSGQPHELLYVGPDGSVETDSIRLVGNVLAWTVGDLTVRIEGAPDLGAALRIADSMR
jgi:hypothetical protein